MNEEDHATHRSTPGPGPCGIASSSRARSPRSENADPIDGTADGLWDATAFSSYPIHVDEYAQARDLVGVEGAGGIYAVGALHAVEYDCGTESWLLR